MNLKRLKWGRSRRRPYAYQVHLHRYEDEVIARKFAELHARESGKLSYYDGAELCRRYPDLFYPPLLKKALKRMHLNGMLVRQRSSGFFKGWGWAYALREEMFRRARAA